MHLHAVLVHLPTCAALDLLKKNNFYFVSLRIALIPILQAIEWPNATIMLNYDVENACRKRPEVSMPYFVQNTDNFGGGCCVWLHNFTRN